MSRIVVLGAGESGAGAAVLAKVKGFDTFVSDMSAIKDKYKELLNKHGIAWEEGQHTEELILNADEVVKSPGIPNDAPLILKLKEKGMSIISEIEFAGRYTNAKMICITGSNGKTTTTSLIYHIFKSAGLNVGLAGNIGNSLEVMESMDVLKGKGPADLTEVCLQLAANMLVLAGKGTPAECRAMAQAVIADGSAFAKCKEMFAAQGGDTRVLDDYSLFEQPAASFELLAEQDGYIVANDAEKIGSASVLLGAGRQKKGDPLDFAAGITLHKKRGDYVHKGESLATFYGAADKFEAAAAEYRSGLVYGAEKPEEAPLVYALVTKDGVERY